MRAAILRGRRFRRAVARQLHGDKLRTVDRQQIPEKNKMKAAGVDMTERRELHAFSGRQTAAIEIDAVAAAILDDPAVRISCQNKVLAADVGTVETDVGLLRFAGCDPRFSADDELFKLQLLRRAFPEPRREGLAAASEKAADGRAGRKPHGSGPSVIVCGESDLVGL